GEVVQLIIRQIPVDTDEVSGVVSVDLVGVESGGRVDYLVLGESFHEGGHLLAGDVVFGAELVVVGRVATACHVGVGQPGDVVVEYIGVGDVVEPVSGHYRQRCDDE